MKKLSLLLAMMLAMATFGGCGKDEIDDDNSRSTKKSSVSEEKDSSEDDSSGKKDSSEDDTSDEKDNEDVDFSRGIITEDTYTNDYSGINFELPEGWRFMSDEEIKQTMGVGLDVSGSGLDADTMVKQSIYDCAACDMITGNNIIFVYEDLSRYADDFSVEDYMKLAKASLSMTMPGAEVEWEDDGQKRTLCGMEFDVYRINMILTDYNLSVTEEMYARQIGDYMLLITYSTGDPDSSMADFAGYFKE